MEEFTFWKSVEVQVVISTDFLKETLVTTGRATGPQDTVTFVLARGFFSCQGQELAGATRVFLGHLQVEAPVIGPLW